MTDRSRGAYDVVFGSDDRVIGYQLAAPVVNFNADPGRLDEQVRNADVPRIVDNLDAGMGWSRRVANVPNGYSYGLPAYTRAPGGIFMPPGKLTAIPVSGAGWNPAVGIFDSVMFNGSIYLIPGGGDAILGLASDGSVADVVHTFPAGFDVRCATVFNNRLYVGGVGGLAYLDALGSWSSVVAGSRLQLRTASWRPLGVPTDMLIAVNGTGREITWCPITADPMNPSLWSAPVAVGPDRRYGIQRLVAAPRHIYMLRPDGVWDMDELGTRAYNLTPWVEESADQANGRWGLHVGDGLYYAHTQGLAFVPTDASESAQRRPEWAQPGYGLPYEGPIRGTPTAGTLVAGVGMVGLSTGSGGYLMAGKRGGPGAEASNGQATHTWHGAEAILAGNVTHLRPWTIPAAGGLPRLLIAEQQSAAPQTHLWWQSLPTMGSPLQDMLWGGGFVPADAASLFLPADPWDRPSSVKTLLQFDMITERIQYGSDVFRAYARADEDTAWTDYGTAEDGSNTSLAPLETVEGRYIQVRVDAVGHPILRSLELRSAVGVELREARRYSLLLAYDNALRNGRARESSDPERKLDDLRSLLGRICTLDDGSPSGPSRVRVLQVLPGQKRPMGGPSRAAANGAEGAWMVTAEVLVSILDRPFRWDGPPATDIYDRDRQWT